MDKDARKHLTKFIQSLPPLAAEQGVRPVSDEQLAACMAARVASGREALHTVGSAEPCGRPMAPVSLTALSPSSLTELVFLCAPSGRGTEGCAQCEEEARARGCRWTTQTARQGWGRACAGVGAWACVGWGLRCCNQTVLALVC